MKFASVRLGDATRVIAHLGDGALIDVNSVTGDEQLTLQSIVLSSSNFGEAVRESIRTADSRHHVDSDDLEWLPPISIPSKIVGVALNNDVFNWLARRKMTAPMYFLTPASAMVGHGGDLCIDPAWGLVHPEPELAAVIGTTLHHVTPPEALSGVFGYTVINDITSPGIKSADSVELVMPEGITVDEQWRSPTGDDDRSLYLTYHARSKGTDTFAPIGPWVVTSDEIDDPNDLAIRSFLDDTLILEDSTANLTFAVGDVLSHLSHSMTLVAGDIVHFGTATRPADPDRFPTIRSIDLARFGDVVSVEIERIGRLDTRIVRAGLAVHHPC